MPKAVDLTGTRRNRLTAVKFVGRDVKNAKRLWEFLCDCGNTTVAASGSFLAQTVKSCGCLRSEVSRAQGLLNATHGLARQGLEHPLYGLWVGMHRRCKSESRKEFKSYGARGITVCARWGDFAAFVLDVGNRPPGKTLDRENNDKGYEPGNVRWATSSEQGRNKRTSKLFSCNGIALTVAGWSEVTGIAADTLRKRLYAGWLVENAIKTPLNIRKLKDVH